MLKLKHQFDNLMWRANSLEKILMMGKSEDRRRGGDKEDEMVGRHHWINGHEFEQTLGDSEGHGSLACWGPWGRKELDTTAWLNSNNLEALSLDSKVALQSKYPPEDNLSQKLFWRQVRNPLSKLSFKSVSTQQPFLSSLVSLGLPILSFRRCTKCTETSYLEII